MNEEEAEKTAEILGGSAWHSGGGIWLVTFERTDGKLVVLSDEVVCEYPNWASFENSKPVTSVVLH